MYLQNDPRKRFIVLQHGDRLHINKNGRAHMTRNGVKLVQGGSSEYLIHPGHPVSPGEIAKLIAHTHGCEISSVVGGGSEENIYEFI